MSLATEWARLSLSERMAVVYVVGLLAALAIEAATSSTDAAAGDPPTDHVGLNERALQYLETGGQIEVDRWHGGTARITCDPVLDADKAEVEE